MDAPTALTVDTFVALHRLHFSRSIIGKLTGFSSAYVGQILFDAGMCERWNRPDDCRAALPASLLESCDNLTSANTAQPVDPRKALAITRRLEFWALIERGETSG